MAKRWETFQPVRVGIKYAFKSYHNKYLVAGLDGSLNANTDRIGVWEQFRVESPGFQKLDFSNHSSFGLYALITLLGLK